MRGIDAGEPSAEHLRGGTRSERGRGTPGLPWGEGNRAHLKSLSLDVIFSSRLEMWKAAVLMLAAPLAAGGSEYGGAASPPRALSPPPPPARPAATEIAAPASRAPPPGPVRSAARTPLPAPRPAWPRPARPRPAWPRPSTPTGPRPPWAS